MTDTENKYFTIGEFAKLFDISKQTLFYYERNHIFLPAFTDKNGYRYYSLKQYFIFEMIMTLRILQIPLKKIAWYIEHRSLENLQTILTEKYEELDRQAAILRLNQQHLQTRIQLLEEAQRIRTDKITLENHRAESIAVTPFVTDHEVLKNNIQCIARHNHRFITGEVVNEYLTGYILPKDTLLAGRYKPITALFTPVSDPAHTEGLAVKPAGLYATIYKKDSYHTRYMDGLEKLQAFIDRNDLTITGDAYIYPIHNYWSTANTDDYITRISVLVDYKES